jgi:hypothetical protein
MLEVASKLSRTVQLRETNSYSGADMNSSRPQSQCYDNAPWLQYIGGVALYWGKRQHVGEKARCSPSLHGYSKVT